METDPLSQGFAFKLTDIWRHSTFQADPNSDTLFRAIPADFADLKLERLDIFDHEKLEIPPLAHTNGDADPELEELDSEAPSLATPVFESPTYDEAAIADIWTLGLSDTGASPGLRTWEAFERKDVPHAERTPYLSEAGPTAFDTTLMRAQPQGASKGVLPHDVMLRALSNLALGRSSIFFEWDPLKQTFTRTLTDVPISGYSAQCCDSLIERLTAFGTRYRILAHSNILNSRRDPCTALVAFKGCVSTIIDAVERKISADLVTFRTFLQLERSIEQPDRLLTVIAEMVESVNYCESDENLISRLSDCVHRVVSSESRHAEVLEEILSRVSAPWLERLCTDLGLANNEAALQATQYEDLHGSNFDVLGTSLDSRVLNATALDSVVRNEDRLAIEETKASLAILRKHLPHRALVARDDSFQQTLSLVSNTASSSRSHPPTPAVPQTCVTIPATEAIEYLGSGTQDGITAEHFDWSNNELNHAYLADLDARMSQPVIHLRASSSGLDSAITSVFESIDLQKMDYPMPHAIEFDPLSHLRPLIEAQCRRTNRAVLRYLFQDCQLRRHFELQRQYHLLGNGDFVARLSTALFSTDTQSVERKRGTIPTAEAMGLRLGAREGQRWPPASSELRLTLVGVLTEAYRAEFSSPVRTMHTKDLPGNLSFTIRELPDEDIERAMDPGSIYALDFLKLQYTATPPLHTIFTQQAMQTYDSVFRLLLKLLRVLHATTLLRHTAIIDHTPLLESTSAASVRERFLVEAHHFISVLMCHIGDLGIAAPWKSFVSSLDALEETTTISSTHRGLISESVRGFETLRRSHQTCLDSIKSRLFLRRKQEKIRSSLENILSHILRGVSAAEDQNANHLQQSVASFTGSVTTFLGLLQTASTKQPPKTVTTYDSMQDDAEIMRLLFTKLDFNGHYRIPNS